MEYKRTCAGLHCKNIPTDRLKVALIKKSGWFCALCKKSLEADGLIESVVFDNMGTGGESNFEE